MNQFFPKFQDFCGPKAICINFVLKVEHILEKYRNMFEKLIYFMESPYKFSEMSDEFYYIIYKFREDIFIL